MDDFVNKIFINENPEILKNIVLNEEGKYSITYQQDSELILNEIEKRVIDKKSINIIDCTGGFCGDTYTFCKKYPVIAFEKNKENYNLLINNLDILLNDKENYLKKVINQDFVSGIKNNSNLLKNFTILYIDPPWGGPEYKNKKNINVYINSIDIIDILLFNSFVDKYKIVLKLPKNYNFNKLYSKLNKFSINTVHMKKISLAFINF